MGMIVIVTDSTGVPEPPGGGAPGRDARCPLTYTLDGVTHREHFVEENGDYIARIEGAKTFATRSRPSTPTSRLCGAAAGRPPGPCACPSPRACREPMPTRSSAPARWQRGHPRGRYADDGRRALHHGARGAPVPGRGLQPLGDGGEAGADARQGQDALFRGGPGAPAPQRPPRPRAPERLHRAQRPAPAHLPGGRGHGLRPGPRQERADPRPAQAVPTGARGVVVQYIKGHRGRAPSCSTAWRASSASPSCCARSARCWPSTLGVDIIASPGWNPEKHPPQKDPPRSRKPGARRAFFYEKVSLRGAGARPAGDRAPARGKRSPRPAARPGTARPCPSGPARTAGAGSSLALKHRCSRTQGQMLPK